MREVTSYKTNSHYEIANFERDVKEVQGYRKKLNAKRALGSLKSGKNATPANTKLVLKAYLPYIQNALFGRFGFENGLFRKK